MLNEEEANAFYKQILDIMDSLIKCEDTNIVKPAFKKYLELLFNDQAHYFGAQICVIFMQLIEMILKLKFQSGRTLKIVLLVVWLAECQLARLSQSASPRGGQTHLLIITS